MQNSQILILYLLVELCDVLCQFLIFIFVVIQLIYNYFLFLSELQLLFYEDAV